MKSHLDDLSIFVAVARAGGFREAAKSGTRSASSLSEAIRRLESQLGVRLLNRTTRHVSPTEAGQGLLERLSPALKEVEAALDVVNIYKDRPAGTLRLNVPVNVARNILPQIVPPFLAAYPEIKLEIMAQTGLIDLLAEGFDAGIRYDERLEQDMIAVPIGPRTQQFALGASKTYLDRKGHPQHPRDLLDHDCIVHRFSGGGPQGWELEKDGESVVVMPEGPLVIRSGGAADLAVRSAIAGTGVIALFRDWLDPIFATGELEPILQEWWPTFSGPYLYYPGRRLVPAPLRAFVDFIKTQTFEFRQPPL
ncbi:LysR family transcriptional regulator [Roseibium limicola]|uniref:LysR family transcriptional regulator n=1 Tax=Roseibium limicola TaxID=2816037 RepID=A0A939EMP6_9HYPH|nr:LysR family transcriptional regulator [Roseibium limicola]MBO0345253.1 LysR family transcriptional regulator [Roseibium limicola]